MSAPSRLSGVSRRGCLETTAAAGAGLVIGFHLPSGGRVATPPAAPFAPNAWLRISPDNSVLIVVDRSEMGQGVATALPMLVAEGLDADWTKVKIESAPADKSYVNPLFGFQGTGGSTSVRAAYTPLRKAGAAAREMLVAAACQTWGGDRVDCRTERGAVIHTGSKRQLTYAQLPGEAGAQQASATAKRGRAAPAVKLADGPTAPVSGARISQLLSAAAAKPGAQARHDGDPDGALGGAANKVEAAYELPFLAHATMEPMNCTAHVRADGVDIWAPTQFQTGVQGLGAKIGGVPPEKVQVHTTYLGGGFGRRFELDFIQEALETSKVVGAPVKVVWSREDDTQHDQYRPVSYHAFHAGLDASGKPVAWTHRIVAPSIMARVFPQTIKNGIDGEAVEGGVGMPYAIDNV